MTGKHYNWHQRWKVDLSACTATHDSGLVVQFKQAEDDPRAWDGSAVNSEAWFAGIKDTMPPQDLSKHVARLMREAGEVYQWQLKKRH